MNFLLYWVGWSLVLVLRSLPLTWVARLGRAGGALAYLLDARHRRVVLKNLTLCFGREKSPAQLHALARETFRRIGENYACAIHTAFLDRRSLDRHLEFVGAEKILRHLKDPGNPAGCVVALGHFGNFELYSTFMHYCPGWTGAATYRGLRQPGLNRLMQLLRSRSGVLFFERRTQSAALRAALSQKRLLLGLLADQHAGRSGLRIPFFGRPCSTTSAPALLALRYHTPLYVSICYRIGLGRWRIEISDAIATRDSQGAPRTKEAIMIEVNTLFEAAIRRDPANWFWVHNRWKTSHSTAAAEPETPDSPDHAEL